MEPDYPAAHSMDTDWFAVDKCGHVALFRSGEAGAVPVEAVISLGPDGGDDEVREALFGKLSEEDEGDGDEIWPDAKGAGLFDYEHEQENWISGPYQRTAKPDKPVRLEDLPPDMRDKLKALRFNTLCFQETAHLQPVEHVKCESWQPAWLSLDGKNARPMPGHEKEYRDAYENLKADSAGDDITWEAPKGGPTPQGASGGIFARLKRLFGGS